MTEGGKRTPASFYAGSGGSEPVRDWLRQLDADDRRLLGRDIATLEYGWPIGMPLCRALGGGLWEVRSSLSGGRIARVMFCIVAGRIVLLHGFVKKTQKAPHRDMELARRRQKEVET